MSQSENWKSEIKVFEVVSAKGSEGMGGLSCAFCSTPGGLLAILGVPWLVKALPLILTFNFTWCSTYVHVCPCVQTFLLRTLSYLTKAHSNGLIEIIYENIISKINSYSHV